MIARMTKDGVITIEPQNDTEAFALKEWEKRSKVEVDATLAQPDPHFWRFDALVVKVA